MKWRIIQRELHNAAMSMAIDEALAFFVGEGKSPPTMRLYSWNPPAVSIGYFQNLHETVNIDKCSNAGVDYIRRLSGGSACLHDSVSYSMVAPVYMFSRFLGDSFKTTGEWVVRALKQLGIDSSFRPLDEIAADGKTISRCAGTVKGGVLIIHGTVFFSMDAGKAALLHMREEKMQELFTSVAEHSTAKEEDVIAALEKSFAQGKEWAYGSLSKEELLKAQELSLTYSSRKWNFMED